MTALTLERDAVQLPAIPADGGLLRVRLSSLVPGKEPGTMDEGPISEPAVDMQLIIAYTAALAGRTAAAVRDGTVTEIDHPHIHPTRATCLRCATFGCSQSRTLAATLLEILDSKGADEDWNRSRACSNANIASRLRRLSQAISSASMESLYGPYWGEVMVTALRIENTDFDLMRYLIKQHKVTPTLQVTTRESMMAYHLGMLVFPRENRDGKPLSLIERNAAAVCLAAAMGWVAVGRAPQWLDHLAGPAL